MFSTSRERKNAGRRHELETEEAFRNPLRRKSDIVGICQPWSLPSGVKHEQPSGGAVRREGFSPKSSRHASSPLTPWCLGAGYSLGGAASEVAELGAEGSLRRTSRCSRGMLPARRRSWQLRRDAAPECDECLFLVDIALDRGYVVAAPAEEGPSRRGLGARTGRSFCTELAPPYRGAPAFSPTVGAGGLGGREGARLSGFQGRRRVLPNA